MTLRCVRVGHGAAGLLCLVDAELLAHRRAIADGEEGECEFDDEEEDIFDEDEGDTDDRGDGPTKIVPRRPGEFLCSSCFLVMPRHMMADEARSLCRDCA